MMRKSLFLSRNTLLLYFTWHYKDAPGKVLGIWKNFIKFVFRFFSISFLARTYFLPWKRIVVYRGRGFSIKEFFEVSVFNLFSRFMGMFLRTVLIIVGFTLEFFILVGGLFVFVLWLVLPFLVVIGFIVGIILLI